MPLQNSAAAIPLFKLRNKGALQAREPKIVPASLPGKIFTDFYCQSGGSNLNAGNDTNNAALYTATNGNWNGTSVYVPTDGSNPYASGVRTDMFASVYVDGATVPVYVARVVSVVNVTNGTITLDTTAIAGAAPSSSATARTINIGGAWKGPNGSDGWPLNTSFASCVDSTGHPPRINFKNDAVYSISALISLTNVPVAYQGYSSTPGDGGKANLDGGNNAIVLVSGTGPTGPWLDFIFSNNGTSGTNQGTNIASSLFVRCVFHDFRGPGSVSTAGNTFFECEFYNCNLAASATTGAISHSSGTTVLHNCYIHDCGGTTAGVRTTSGTIPSLVAINSIFDSLGGNAIEISNSNALLVPVIVNCDFYNCAAGVKDLSSSTSVHPIYIFNCNFLKNQGYAVDPSGPGINAFGLLYNCGFGGGSQVNQSGRINLASGVRESGSVTYPADATPWNAPATGDFSTILAAAISAGRGHFEQNSGTKTGTAGYPDIGAAQAQVRTQAWAGQDLVLPDSFINHFYSYVWTLASSGSFSIVSGSLPPGLSLTPLSSLQAEIIGTPTATGTYNFTLRLTVGTSTGDATYHITVRDDPDEGIGALMGGLRPTV